MSVTFTFFASPLH